MLANELIDRLERLGLLDQEIIEALREQLDQGTRVTPEAVAKLLVDNGQLTRFQATKLIGELRSGQYDEAEAVEVVEEVDDLAVLPDEAAEEIASVDVVDDGVQEVFAEPVAEVEAAPVQSATETAEASATPVAAEPDAESRPKRSRPKPEKPKSVWDSFKIYGFAGIIILLCLVGYGLWYMLSRKSADEFIAEANKAYDQQNYTPAQEMYIGFLENYGDNHQFSSISRTRVTMTELYRAETMSDPTRALDLAKEKLPAIEEEEGLNEERGNLAALLVDIAENIANEAGDAKETIEKKRLLGRLDEQLELLENPNYMTTAMKTTLSGKLLAISEARARVRRDINRNIRLDESVLKMAAAIEAQKTKEAYDIRFQLLREFPELHDNERIMTLIREASGVQKTLVTPAADLPNLVDASEPDSTLRSIVLTTRDGRPAPDLRGEILYLRAGGSMLAFAGEDGKLLWRKFIGYGQDHLPVRLDDGSGVLLSDFADLEIQRCDGKDGRIRWRSKIEESFREPITQDDDVYVSTESGRLLSIDAISGDAKWATQIPQSLDAGPGIDGRSNRLYVAGDHSNLYVLNSRDGSCLESFYTGHDKGTVVVPPIPLLGHLFVLDNAGTDYTRVHVLRFDDTGQNLQQAQPPFRLTGNVRVKPIIQGRRIIVLTDRGQVAVYEVEPTAENEQVSEVAGQVASYDQPTATQMAVGRSQMWVTGTRIGRYELQINTGRVVQDWFKHEADNFIGQPFATDDTLVHARILRGTSAIRVTAADPKSGDEIWTTDVGVPISMITPVPGDSAFHAVTSQATLFVLNRDALSSGATQGPLENAGVAGIEMKFAHPIPIDETKALMLNQTGSGGVLVYDPSRRRGKIRRVQMGLSSGRPGNGAIVSGGGLFLPLDTGRIVLMDWQTGGSKEKESADSKGAAFQPPSEPGGRVKWSESVSLPDDPDQVIIADSRKKIYRLRAGEVIRELASKDLEAPFLGPTAAVDDKLLATVHGPSADFLVGHDLLGLDQTFKVLLDGRVNWGPVTAGNFALLRTDDSMLRAFGSDGKQLFAVEVPKGKPVGLPVNLDGKILLAGSTGWMITLDPESGELLGRDDIGQPISSSPYPIGKSLLVPGTEGVVYIADVPSKL